MEFFKRIFKNKKTRDFLVAVVLLLATYLLIVFITENDNSFDENLPVSNMKNTANNIETILKDELYVIQNIRQDEKGYDIDIYYPYTTDEALNSYINTKLELYIKDIKFQASNYQNEVQKGKYKLNISFDVTKSSDLRYISFIFIVNEDIKYLHPNESIFVINYDKEKKQIIMQQDVENMYPNLYYNLSKYTYDVLSKNESIKNMGAHKMLEEGTKANRYNFMDIAFKENNMLVIFEKTQVAPYVLGRFEVEVPMEYLKCEEKYNNT